MNKKIIIGIIIILILGIILFNIDFNKKETIKNEKPTVKIGISIPLTGDLGYAGETNKIAINMVLEKWKKINTKYNYKIIVEDNRYEPRVVKMTINKLINMDKVNALVSFWTMPGKLFTEANNNSSNPIPHLACSWGKDVMVGDYNFNNDPSIESYVNILIKKLKKENIKNIGFIFQNTADDIEMQEAIVDKIRKTDINITFNENFNYGSKDYRTFLSKVKNMPTEIIYFHLFQNDLNTLYKQMREFNINLPLTTIDYFEEVEDKRPFEGNWFITTNIGDYDFLEYWRNNYELLPASCITNTYDNIDILISSFENAEAEEEKIPTSESLLKYLKSLKTWDGVSGDLTFRENGQIDYEPKLAIIKNGKIEVLEE